MKKLIVVAICLCAVVAVAQQLPRQGGMIGPGMGGPAAGTPPTPTALKKALGLSDAEVTRLLALQRERIKANATSLQAVRDKQRLLDDTLAAGGASAATLGQMLLDIQAARNAVQENDKKYHTLALAVLTADQLTKLATVEEAMKLQPAIHQAIGLNLIEGAAGPAPGPGRMMGGPMGPPR